MSQGLGAMKSISVFLVTVFLMSGSLAFGNDLGTLTETNLIKVLGWTNGHLAKDFQPLEQILKLYTYRRDPLSENQIVAPGGWKFLGAYFDTPIIESKSIRFNVLLNQTHLSHVDSMFVIERRSQVFQMVLGASSEGQQTAQLFVCQSPQTFSSIYFQRPMNHKQLKAFIPNPILALARVARIGFGNIRHDPFGHFDQLMGLFNKVKGVDMTLDPSERAMVQSYTDTYKTFDKQFLPGGNYTNPCDGQEFGYIPVEASQTLIF